MLKTEAYLVILLILEQNFSLFQAKSRNPVAKASGSFPGSFDFSQDDFAINSTARLIAAIMLSGCAMSLPAISNAVPWSGLVRGNGRPSVTFTPLWNACSFNGINP